MYRREHPYFGESAANRLGMSGCGAIVVGIASERLAQRMAAHYKNMEHA
ncbi:MAG: hypothetical protein IT423_08065 [Pirellulaceae bacterium]|nr:hypothetical protein [Pirellulaceae bacterium]